jgi:hypothetical protein
MERTEEKHVLSLLDCLKDWIAIEADNSCTARVVNQSTHASMYEAPPTATQLANETAAAAYTQHLCFCLPTANIKINSFLRS